MKQRILHIHISCSHFINNFRPSDRHYIILNNITIHQLICQCCVHNLSAIKWPKKINECMFKVNEVFKYKNKCNTELLQL